MLFHITAKHSYETCPAIQHGLDSDETVVSQRWMQGDDNVIVLGVRCYHVSHTVYAVLEATDMQSITSLLRPQMGRGDIQVLPVNDNIAMRKEMGNWGK